MERSARGFTLTETLAVVAVAGVLLALGQPSFTHMRQRSLALSAAHQLTASLALARMAAVGRGRAVAVCAAGADRRCRTDGVWDEGWIAFVDAARRGQPASADDVLQDVGAGGFGGRIRIRSSAARSYSRFLPDGRAAGSNLSIHVCPDDPRVEVISVIVSNAGRPRSQRRPPGDPVCLVPT